MKKAIFVCALVMLAAVFVFAACKPNTPAHEHTFATDWSHDDEYHWHASTCGHDDVTKDKAKHEFDSEGNCVCGFKQGEKTPDDPSEPADHEHKFDGVWHKYESGHQRECSICRDLSPLEEHKFDDGTVLEAATCTTPGKTKFTCTVCGYEKEETVPASDHKYDGTWQTTTEEHYYECTVCHTIDQSSRAQHEFDSGVVDVEPNCGNPGRTKYTCKTCKYEKFEEIPISGEHKYGEAWESDEEHHWHECSVCGGKGDEGTHTWDDGEVLKAATCQEDGEIKYICTQCKYESKQVLPKDDAHQYDEKGVCKDCGDTNGPIAHDITWVEGEKFVEIGMYPQSRAEQGTELQLNLKAGTPTNHNSDITWTDSGYRVTVDGKEMPYMWFINISYENDVYRGVFFNRNRPSIYNVLSGTNYQDTNGYKVNKTYWFKYEPIKWRVLSDDNGEYFLLSELILDTHEFYYDKYVRNEDGVQIWPNNYEKSLMRSWLNDTFYKTAFDSNARKAIKRTKVDNGLDSIKHSQMTDSAEKYVCSDTYDYVFLLSAQEVTNTEYGFASDDIDESDEIKNKEVTDYAKCQGVYTFEGNHGMWCLRSPGNSNTYSVLVNRPENSFNDGVTATYIGIVPAIKANLTKDSSIVTE